MVHDYLTHQFRVARKAGLIDGTQLMLVSPDVLAGSDRAGAGFALDNFIKTSLPAFTATLGPGRGAPRKRRPEGRLYKI